MSPKIKLAPPSPPDEAGFAEVAGLIAAARQRAFQAVNTSLIDLYWQVGQYISHKIEATEWGDGVVPQLAAYIARTQPGMRGFTTSNLFRMKKFYETYRNESISAPLAHQLPWSHNLIILGQSKRPEEREFYLRMAVRERWTKRELERQFKAALFERVVLSPAKLAPVVRQMYPEAQDIFKDAYTVEFLGLPQDHTENDLHRGLLNRMKSFCWNLAGISALSAPNFLCKSAGAILPSTCSSSIADSTPSLLLNSR